jgi:hypothetical protein
MLSGLSALTPGGVGQTQALDIATLRDHASRAAIGAFSINQDSVMTIWNVVLGLIVMLWPSRDCEKVRRGQRRLRPGGCAMSTAGQGS